MKHFVILIVIFLFSACAGKTPKPAVVSPKEFNELKKRTHYVIEQVARQETDNVRTQKRLKEMEKNMLQAARTAGWFGFLLKGASIHVRRIYKQINQLLEKENELRKMILRIHPKRAKLLKSKGKKTNL